MVERKARHRNFLILTMHPAGLFDTEEEAETFALKFATEYIDGRTK
jgi:hypothetical protein